MRPAARSVHPASFRRRAFRAPIVPVVLLGRVPRVRVADEGGPRGRDRGVRRGSGRFGCRGGRRGTRARGRTTGSPFPGGGLRFVSGGVDEADLLVRGPDLRLEPLHPVVDAHPGFGDRAHVLPHGGDVGVGEPEPFLQVRARPGQELDGGRGRPHHRSPRRLGVRNEGGVDRDGPGVVRRTERHSRSRLDLVAKTVDLAEHSFGLLGPGLLDGRIPVVERRTVPTSIDVWEARPRRKRIALVAECGRRTRPGTTLVGSRDRGRILVPIVGGDRLRDRRSPGLNHAGTVRGRDLIPPCSKEARAAALPLGESERASNRSPGLSQIGSSGSPRCQERRRPNVGHIVRIRTLGRVP